MDAGMVVGSGLDECLVHQAVAVVPFGSTCERVDWQVDGLGYPGCEGSGLAQRLSVELVNPLGGAVGRDDDERLVLIVGLGHGGREVEQGRAAGDADDDRLVGGLGDAEGEESGGALVGDGVARDVGALVQVVHNGGIARAGADDGVADAVGHE